MDQGEPGKDLPILEQTWEADPHETESSKKMEAATEPTLDMLSATIEMVNARLRLQPTWHCRSSFPPSRMCPPPPAELSKVIFFFADIDCGFSSKYVVIFLEKEVCGD